MSSICPYPGLRPFTEGESIYFKGRDTHIEQIIAQFFPHYRDSKLQLYNTKFSG